MLLTQAQNILDVFKDTDPGPWFARTATCHVGPVNDEVPGGKGPRRAGRGGDASGQIQSIPSFRGGPTPPEEYRL